MGKLEKVIRSVGYILVFIIFVGGLVTDQYQHCYIAIGLLVLDVLSNVMDVLVEIFNSSCRRGYEIRELNIDLNKLIKILDKKETEAVEPLRVGSFGAKGQKKLARKINEVIERNN